MAVTGKDAIKSANNALSVARAIMEIHYHRYIEKSIYNDEISMPIAPNFLHEDPFPLGGTVASVQRCKHLLVPIRPSVAHSI